MQFSYTLFGRVLGSSGDELDVSKESRTSMPTSFQLSSPEHMDHFKVIFAYHQSYTHSHSRIQNWSDLSSKLYCDIWKCSFPKQMASPEQLFNEMRMYLPPPQLDVQNGAIYTKAPICHGFRFAFCQVKWTKEPLNKNVALEVSSFTLNCRYFFCCPWYENCLGGNLVGKSSTNRGWNQKKNRYNALWFWKKS